MSCGFKVLSAFVALAILAAFFFVPVRQTTVTEQYGSASGGTRTISSRNGYVVLPMYLRAYGTRIFPGTGAKITTTLRVMPYAIEVGGILALGIIDYFIFCVWIRRKNSFISLS